eukprot:9587603-Karenia_brevis.AAC.1
MTQSRRQQLRSAQRRMLRTILGSGQRIKDNTDSSSSSGSTESSKIEEELESWVEWIQRVTTDALEAMTKAGVPDWVDEQIRRKWTWCGHVCRRTDGRWAKRILGWSPMRGRRCQGHPLTRWCDDVDMFTKSLESSCAPQRSRFAEWSATAMDRETWTSLESKYVDFCWRGD